MYLSDLTFTLNDFCVQPISLVTLILPKNIIYLFIALQIHQQCIFTYLIYLCYYKYTLNKRNRLFINQIKGVDGWFWIFCVQSQTSATRKYCKNKAQIGSVRHSSLVEFSPSDIWRKTIPTTFIAFSIWYGYLCPPHKILGGLYESSREHVFKFISISFIQRGTLMKNRFFGRFKKTP